MEIPPREPILEPILAQQSLGMLFAKRGIGKTYVSLGIACAVAAGAPFLRWKAPEPRRVLYVDGEMPAVTMQQRLAAVVAGMNREIDPGYLRLITPDLQDSPMPSLCGSVGQSMVEDSLNGTELLIIDNLSCLCANAKENELESWLGMQAWLLSLRQRRLCVLVIHHAGRNGEQRGTSAREDQLDVLIRLQRPSDYRAEEGARFEIHYNKAREQHGGDVAPIEVQLRVDAAAAIWTMRDLEDALESRAAQMFRDGVTVRDAAEDLGISKSAAQRLKRKLGL
jgi:putative DNA primase/helicase